MAVKIKPHGFIQRCTVHLFNFCTGGECTGIADQNINPAKSSNTFNYRRSNRFIIGDITNNTLSIAGIELLFDRRVNIHCGNSGTPG